MLSKTYIEQTSKFAEFRESPLVILDGDQLFISGISSADEDMETASIQVFETLSEILKEHGFTYDDIVRQWNYIGEILKIKMINGLHVQNYQVFNDIRNRYYRQNKTTSDFPAATGIGMKRQGLVVDVFAKKPSENVQNLPLRSRIQKDAHAYSEAVLVGDEKNKKPPLFERARLLVSKDEIQIFVSGTASIENQETVGIGDVSLQTENTIQYIKDLVSVENILHNYPTLRLRSATVANQDNYVRYFRWKLNL
jgi:enamine deaminase RidA (YjgF/YER057c/UK114 family)